MVKIGGVVIEGLSHPLITINPVLFNSYHCAMISAEQRDSEYFRFSLDELQNLLNEKGFPTETETINYNSLLKNILVSFGNRFIEIDQQGRKAFLFYTENFDLLKNRAIALSYLFNQKKLIIFPKNEKQVIFTRLKKGRPLVYDSKTREIESFDDVITKFFELSNKNDAKEIILKENKSFINSSPIILKMALYNRGKNIDQLLLSLKNDAFIE